MKYLTVIRHAKSSWSEAGMADHERPLNARGNFAAPIVGRFLAKTYFGADAQPALMVPPELIVASTALRTLQTAQHMTAAFRLGVEQMSLQSRLYLASKETILEVVRGLDEKLRHAVIIAHNPGIHEFCDAMLARAQIPEMPTCTTVILTLPQEHWGLADFGTAQLVAHLTPRVLERRFPSEWTPA
jgi:phosphohistidine phosphatase